MQLFDNAIFAILDEFEKFVHLCLSDQLVYHFFVFLLQDCYLNSAFFDRFFIFRSWIDRGITSTTTGHSSRSRYIIDRCLLLLFCGCLRFLFYRLTRIILWHRLVTCIVKQSRYFHNQYRGGKMRHFSRRLLTSPSIEDGFGAFLCKTLTFCSSIFSQNFISPSFIISCTNSRNSWHSWLEWSVVIL